MSEPRALVRPAVHLATGLAAVWVLVAPPPWRLGGLLGVLGVAILGDGLRRQPAFRQRSDRWLPGVYRPAETGGISGASLLMLGYVAAGALFAPEAAAAGIAAAAAGDPAAALAGQWRAARAADHRRAQPRVIAGATGGKTWFGSLACFLASAAALWLLPQLGLPAAAAAAGVATVGERLSGRYDNIVVPLAVAGFVHAWLLPA